MDTPQQRVPALAGAQPSGCFHVRSPLWRQRLRTMIALLTIGILAPCVRAQVILNELMADNRSAVENGPDFPDYVELLNSSAQSVNLSGWSLTDDPALPRRYVFPNGVTLPAGGRLMVWCDANTASPGLHTGFGLGATGDLVRLYAADGVTLIDAVSFGLQVGNISLGRIPDATGSWILTRPTPLAANEAQPLAEAAALRINEWMARPAAGEDWIELYNPENLPAPLGGFVLTDSPGNSPNNRPIPALSFIAPRGFIQFFASDLQRLDADHLDFKLSAEGETLTLYAPNRGAMIDRVLFGAQPDNVSQGRVPDGADAFASFAGLRITPGLPNSAEIAGVVINEVLTHTDPPLEDAIELHTPSSQSVDISHWWLSDSLAQPKKYRIPPNTVIPPGGFAVFYNNQFGAGATGFSLNSFEGDNVVLSAGGADGNLTGQQTFVSFGALRNGVSMGRHATSAGVDFVPLSARTFGVDSPTSVPQFRLGAGKTNAPPRLSPVVINEIHFHPPGTNNNADEFIELHNPTASSVSLFDPNAPMNTWRLRDGITFDFPFNIRVPAGGFVVLVSFDPQQEPVSLDSFRSRFSVPASVPVLGPFQGGLSNTGETLELLHPDEPEGPDSSNAGFVPYELQERIKYSPATPWPAGAAGTGQSLQRRDALAYGNEPLHWFVSNPTAGRANISNPDGDGDGLPDAWELANGLNPGDPTDADKDADDDGQSNKNEFLSGTNPGDVASVFRIVSLQTAGAAWWLTMQTVAGRAYTMEFRANAVGGEWQSIAAVPANEVTGLREVMITLPGATSGFLRAATAASP